MFGRKSDSPERKIENEETAKACHTCGCVVLTAKLKQVERSHEGIWSGNKYDYYFYYCRRCAPPYNKVQNYSDGTVHYFRRVPEHFVEVTEKGKEIKPKKGE